jgi:hypothetical protein
MITLFDGPNSKFKNHYFINKKMIAAPLMVSPLCISVMV